MTDEEILHEPPSGVIPLGYGTFYSKAYDYNEPDNWVGIHEWHKCVDGGYTAGYVAFNVESRGNGNGPKWDVHSWEPLTISPSVACVTCGHHGWIREGKWVPA